MNKPRIWVTEKEAGLIFGVNKKTLDSWRESGYLKPGTHWRSSLDSVQIPWNPEVIYHLILCREFIESFKDHHAPIQNLVA